MEENTPSSETTFVRGAGQRLVAMAFLLAVCGILALVTLKLPWYHFNFAGDITTPGTYEQVAGVTAQQDILGSQLATLDTGDGAMHKSIPVGPGGFIMPVVWMLVSVLLGAAVAFVRNALLSFVGMFTIYLAHGSLGTVRAAMENPTYGGLYNTPGKGMWWFTMILMFSFLLIAAMGIQAFLVNRREKEERRARGEEVAPTIIETVGSLSMSNFTRIASAVVEETSNVKDAAKEKAKK